MWTVSDDVTHARYLSALGKGHGYETTVKSWYEGEQVAELTFASELAAGSVSVTGRNRERRRLQLTARPSLWPAMPGDALSPFGTWLTAAVTVTAGRARYGPIPVFAGKILSVAKDRWGGGLTVVGADPMEAVNRAPFESQRSAGTGRTIPDAILALLQEVFPAATLLDLSGTTTRVPAATAFDAGAGSRGRAIDELAASIGCEVFAKPTVPYPGGDFVLRPVPDLRTGTVAWTLPDGTESVVAADVQLQSAASVVNRWIVTAERSDQVLLRTVVTDDDPASPTRYDGPMGKLVDFFSSPLITSSAQATVAGQAKLARSIGLARPRTVTVIANPAAEAGDILAIGVDGETATYHIADDFTVPLTPDPASMTISTRSTGGDS